MTLSFSKPFKGYAPYAVGKILFDDEAADNDFTIQFAHGLKRSVPIDKVCWIPSVLYDRIVAELKSPQGKGRTVSGKVLAIC